MGACSHLCTLQCLTLRTCWWSLPNCCLLSVLLAMLPAGGRSEACGDEPSHVLPAVPQAAGSAAPGSSLSGQCSSSGSVDQTSSTEAAAAPLVPLEPAVVDLLQTAAAGQGSSPGLHRMCSTASGSGVEEVVTALPLPAPAGSGTSSPRQASGAASPEPRGSSPDTTLTSSAAAALLPAAGDTVTEASGSPVSALLADSLGAAAEVTAPASACSSSADAAAAGWVEPLQAAAAAGATGSACHTDAIEGELASMDAAMSCWAATHCWVLVQAASRALL